MATRTTIIAWRICMDKRSLATTEQLRTDSHNLETFPPSLFFLFVFHDTDLFQESRLLVVSCINGFESSLVE